MASWKRESILIIIGILLLSACARQGIQRDPNRSGIDRDLTGTWLMLDQSNVLASGRVPPPTWAVRIHDDGRVEGVGVHAASGTLRMGSVLYFRQRARQFLWADSSGLQFSQWDRRNRELILGDGKWQLDGNLLSLQLHNTRSGWWTEEYSRVSLGDTVVVPLRISASLRMNGSPVHLKEVSAVPPGSMNVMILDTVTHASICFDGQADDSLDASITVRIHDIDGPGVYPVEAGTPRSGMVTIMDPETGSQRTINRASSGTVIIDELDLETKRCRGRLDVHFDQKHMRSRMRSKMHVTGSFDLPVWISNQYDIQSFRTTIPRNKLRMVEP